MAEIAKYGLYRGKAPAIGLTTFCTVDAALHLVGVALSSGAGFALKEAHLSYFGFVWGA